jgi:hypothetical protein
LEAKALDQFEAMQVSYLVLTDKALAGGSFSEPRCFLFEKDAFRYARACACGNVDQRVLRINAQTLVVATENEI